MLRRFHWYIAYLLMQHVFGSSSDSDDTNNNSPNILFIMMDDMGYSDISARGGNFYTPNLDALYKDAIVLNYHYTASVCSPSRAQFLTGRYAWNMGLSDSKSFGLSDIAGIPVGLPTIGNLLNEYTNGKYKSYATGKWHLGHATSYHLPLKRGFNEFYGFYTSGISYSDKRRRVPQYDTILLTKMLQEKKIENAKLFNEEEYSSSSSSSQSSLFSDLTTSEIEKIIEKSQTLDSDDFDIYDIIGDMDSSSMSGNADNSDDNDDDDTTTIRKYIDWRANEEIDYDTQYEFSTFVTKNRIIDIIEKHGSSGSDAYGGSDSDSDRSNFFIYAPFQAAHSQLEIINSNNGNNCNNNENSQRFKYCLNIMAMDQVIGELIDSLKDNNLYDNTLIVFTSDNGGQYKGGACNYPLRGDKGSFFEGGVRTLTFVGGGYISESQRGTERNEFIHISDWLPTLLSIAGVDITDISNKIQEKIYEPIAEKISLSNHGTIDYKTDYLMSQSFDGIDLSDWLLNGNNNNNNNNNNKRNMVGLAINNVMSNDWSNANDQSNDISIVFESKLTNNKYKIMYLGNLMDSESGQLCNYCEYDSNSNTYSLFNKESIELKEQLSIDKESSFVCSKDSTINDISNTAMLLFDLTLDESENFNLLDTFSLVASGNNAADSVTNNELSINNINDYGDEIVNAVWYEGLEIIENYQNNVMYNNFLSCHRVSFTDEADPSNFEDAWCEFFEWDEYVTQFKSLCKISSNNNNANNNNNEWEDIDVHYMVNQVLFELYTTRYDEWDEYKSNIINIDSIGINNKESYKMLGFNDGKRSEFDIILIYSIVGLLGTIGTIFTILMAYLCIEKNSAVFRKKQANNNDDYVCIDP